MKLRTLCDFKQGEPTTWEVSEQPTTERNSNMALMDNPYDPSLAPDGRPDFKQGDILCFRPRYNSKGKRDVTGAFKPEAEAFCRFHGVDPDESIVIINNGQRKHRSRYPMAREVIAEIKARKPKVTAFFCHGFTHYIQLGPRSPNHPAAQDTDKQLFRQFIKALTDAHVAPNLVLYACSTGNDPDRGEEDTAPGAGDDSFGDVCRDQMCALGATFCRVMSHTTAGHATANPHVKFFDGQGSHIGGTGAAFIVRPGTQRYWPAWRRHLQGDFRFRFPFMTIADIHTELETQF
jgi:hypothetical protein